MGIRKHRRVFPWVFLAVQLLFLLWIVLGARSGSGTPCSSGMKVTTCTSAHQVGTALGVSIIVFLWAAVDVILGVGYAVYRTARRH